MIATSNNILIKYGLFKNRKNIFFDKKNTVAEISFANKQEFLEDLYFGQMRSKKRV